MNRINGVTPTVVTLLAAVLLGVLVDVSPVVAFGVLGFLLIVLVGMKLERVLLLAVTSELALTGIGKVFQVSLGPISLNGSVIFDVLVMGLGLLAIMRRRSRLVYAEQMWMYILVVAAIVSGVFSIDPLSTVKGVLKLISFLVLYAVAREVGAEGEAPVRRVMTYVSWLMFGITALALFEWFAGVNPISLGQVSQNIYSTTGEAILELRRSRSTFAHPNQMAVVMASLGILMVGVARWQRRRLYVFASVAGAVAVLLSFSRIVWGGVVVAGVAVLFGVVPKNRRIATGVAVAGASVALWTLIGDLVRQRMGLDSSAALRLTLVNTGFEVVGDNPLIGTGYETFGVISTRVFGYRIEAHSDYLRLYVETGLMGVVAFVGWLFSGWVRMRRLAVRLKGSGERGLYVAGGGAIILFAAFAVTDNAIQGMGMLVLVIGLLEGLGIDCKHVSTARLSATEVTT